MFIKILIYAFKDWYSRVERRYYDEFPYQDLREKTQMRGGLPSELYDLHFLSDKETENKACTERVGGCRKEEPHTHDTQISPKAQKKKSKKRK